MHNSEYAAMFTFEKMSEEVIKYAYVTYTSSNLS